MKKIKISISSPEISFLADRAVTWAGGTVVEVAKGAFRDTPSTQQHEIIDGLCDGDIMVGWDEQGYVADMSMSFRHRLVPMQDGFATRHAIVLLRELGYDLEPSAELPM